jgi:hypothetical protein
MRFVLLLAHSICGMAASILPDTRAHGKAQGMSVIDLKDEFDQAEVGFAARLALVIYDREQADLRQCDRIAQDARRNSFTNILRRSATSAAPEAMLVLIATKGGLGRFFLPCRGSFFMVSKARCVKRRRARLHHA